MIVLEGYQGLELLYKSRSSLVYRGEQKGQDGLNRGPVIIKMLKEEYPSPRQVARFQREFEITKNLHFEGIIEVFELKKHKNTQIIILEDFGGESLNRLLLTSEQKGLLEIKKFLQLAIQVVQILEKIHQQRVIHKDINPSNIIWKRNVGDDTKGILKLIDFGISSTLSKEVPQILSPNVLEGTLAYMSPEQTGRMNRVMDYRTDFYSLGVTLYQLLTGELPFQSQDAMEMIHYHLAQMPLPIHKIRPEIPPILNDVIFKLMAKNAEDRYQSATGILVDLQNCLQQFQSNRCIESFPLAQKDYSEKLQIPAKLYGREKELDILLEAFYRVSQGSTEMVLISGYSGIGKSALVGELYQAIVQKKGHFVLGKFIDSQKELPFVALIHAFQELIRQIFTESKKELQNWKKNLLHALDSQGQIIIEVIPELEWIIGPQPEVSELPPTASQKRFSRTFQNFVRVFAQPEHPLVLFLDNLRYMDIASAQWIQEVTGKTEIQHFLFVGAYRENTKYPLLQEFLRCSAKTSLLLHEIRLNPLGLDSVTELMTETLSCPLQEVAPLAEMVHQKTQGNPFFVNQFLRALYEEKLLVFNSKELLWKWDLSVIQKREITDNLVEFMVKKLRELSPEIQNILKLASCIGSQFDLQTLSILCQKDVVQTNKELWQALQERYLVPLEISTPYLPIDLFESLDDPSKSLDDPSKNLDESVNFHYQFLHDRIQLAAYSLLSEEEKQKIHLQIGMLFLEKKPLQEGDDLFEIVNHLNQAKPLLLKKKEGYSKKREQLVELNLQAGRRRMTSAAHTLALNYFLTGMELLESDCWETQYLLSLSIYEGAAESACFCAQFEKMEQLVAEVFKNAKTVLDKTQCYGTMITSYDSRNEDLKAVHVGLEALDLLGHPLSKEPDLDDLEQARNSIISVLEDQNFIEKNQLNLVALQNLSSAKDPWQIAILKILAKMTSPASMVAYNLRVILAQKIVLLSLEHGNTTSSITGYTDYGHLLCSFWRDFDLGYKFGQLAHSLLEKYSTLEQEAETEYMINIFLKPWKEHFSHSLEPILKVYSSCIENENFILALPSLRSYCGYSYRSGKELGEFAKEMQQFSLDLDNYRDKVPTDPHKREQQLVHNLQGKSKNPCLLVGKYYDEEKTLLLFKEKKMVGAIFALYSQKLFLYYLFGKYTEAYQSLLKTEECAGSKLTPIGTSYFFYGSLIRLAIYSNSTIEHQKELLQKVKEYQEQYQIWAKHNPVNFLNRWHLVEAEKFRVLGNPLEAMESYKEAIRFSAENKYIQDEALSYELYAKFWRRRGDSEIAQLYLIKAHHLYLLWGAFAKVKDLEKCYPEYLSKKTPANLQEFSGSSLIDSLTETAETIEHLSSSKGLDFMTLMKSSQALSSEIVLEKLLKSLMESAIENAGAQKGCLILERNGDWRIEAEGSIQQSVAYPEPIPLEESQSFSKSIVSYVIKSQVPLLLKEACCEKQFFKDPYILNQRSKSILCAPILYQGKITGVLYLENNLTAGAFTQDRLEILKLLSSQAAISIENARLYSSLKENHQELQETQSQLVQSEKMGSLGILVAGVAHEINNPMNAVYVNARQLEVNLDNFKTFLFQLVGEDAHNEAEKIFNGKFRNFFDNLDVITEGSIRIQDIVGDLRTFSRVDKGRLKQANPVFGLKSTLRLIQPEYRDAVEFICDLQVTPEVECSLARLNQVFMNMLVNACQAILYQRRQSEDLALGRLVISSFIEENENTVPYLGIRFQDTGCGMSEDVQKKMFDPFFTTKPEGRGTGLGLSITHGIIEEHQGKIAVESLLGRGTTITLYIPLYQTFPKENSA